VTGLCQRAEALIVSEAKKKTLGFPVKAGRAVVGKDGYDRQSPGERVAVLRSGKGLRDRQHDRRQRE
jgi:hypothetical protein